MSNHVDVIIVGAGLSGIGAANHLTMNCPDHSYLILEGRASMGGTWDLFKYPGIRSDSDMYTLGYNFRPWTNPKAIADGPAILEYIKETAKDGKVDDKIRYERKVNNISWSSETNQWSINTETPTGSEQYSCNFLYMCSGYYSYEGGYTPDFDGMDDYQGQIVHPQKWPEDLDYQDKKVVVIGSGATAVTLVPAMCEQAAHVTMLQRSPTYIITAPEQDTIANFFRKILPAKAAYRLSRWKNITLGMAFYNYCKKWPNAARKLIMKGSKKELGIDFDEIEKHFSPTYNPWDQRLCLVPNSDLFNVLKTGDASIKTDHIERFTDTGLSLKSGEQLDADLIVTATGLRATFLGGISIIVDGEELAPSDLYSYKGAMFSDIPNLALSFGYTNASWTLKCDLTCTYVCRILNKMKKESIKKVVPRFNDPSIQSEPIIDLKSGYVDRALDHLPKQGTQRPWKVFQNYYKDLLNLKYGSLKDQFLEFS